MSWACGWKRRRLWHAPRIEVLGSIPLRPTQPSILQGPLIGGVNCLILFIYWLSQLIAYGEYALQLLPGYLKEVATPSRNVRSAFRKEWTSGNLHLNPYLQGREHWTVTLGGVHSICLSVDLVLIAEPLPPINPKKQVLRSLGMHSLLGSFLSIPFYSRREHLSVMKIHRCA